MSNARKRIENVFKREASETTEQLREIMAKINSLATRTNEELREKGERLRVLEREIDSCQREKDATWKTVERQRVQQEHQRAAESECRAAIQGLGAAYDFLPAHAAGMPTSELAPLALDGLRRVHAERDDEAKRTRERTQAARGARTQRLHEVRARRSTAANDASAKEDEAHVLDRKISELNERVEVPLLLCRAVVGAALLPHLAAVVLYTWHAQSRAR